MFVAERVGRETPNSEVAGSSPIRSKVLLIRGFLLLFRLSLYNAALLLELAKLLCRNFCSVYLSVINFLPFLLNFYLSIMFAELSGMFAETDEVLNFVRPSFFSIFYVFYEYFFL